MNLHWPLLGAAIFSMMLLVAVVGQTASMETSEEYLKNVISELQQQNRPSAMSLDRTTGPGGKTYYLNNNGQGINEPQKLINDPPIKRPNHQNQYFGVQTHKPIPTAVNGDQDFAESTGYHYQVPKPPTVPKPEKIEHPAPLGLTKAHLASIYKNALQRGSTISLPSPVNAFAIAKKPHIAANHMQLQTPNSAYYYYFYPLKSFASELKPKYKPPDQEVVSQPSGNQPANPLFMAVSGFIGMAMLFMAGVLFMPRLAVFKSRSFQDEFLQLTKIAGAAIEAGHCSERFTCELGKVARTFDLPLEKIRYLETLLPSNLGSHVAKIRKAATRRRECKLIFCRKTSVQKDTS